MPSSTTARGVLLDRARRHVSFAALCRHVGPSDPGWIESLGQMSAISKDGETALEDDLDYEPLSCTLGDRAATIPKSFIWYRLMACAAALLSEDDMLEMSAHYYLAHAISDTLALRNAGERDAPTDLMPLICRELAGRPRGDSETRLFAVLGELITADLEERSPEDIETLCDAFEHVEQELCTAREYISPEYVWGLTRFDSHHGLWLSLVRDHFPTQVPHASELRDSLIEHGARWVVPSQAGVPIVQDDQHSGDPGAPPFGSDAITFFLHRARSHRGRRVALRLAEDCFESEGSITRSDERFPSRLSAMNNAIQAAHAIGAFDLAARWASLAKPYARDNAYLPHNLACAFAAVGRRDDAFAMCAIAVETSDPAAIAHLRDDEDLGSLRSEARFMALFDGRAKPGP